MPVKQSKFAYMAKFFRTKCVPEVFDWDKFWSPKRYQASVRLPLEYDWDYPRPMPRGELRGDCEAHQRRTAAAGEARLEALIKCSKACHVPTLVTLTWRGSEDDKLTLALKGENAACRQALIDFDQYNKRLSPDQRMWQSASLDDFIDDDLIGPYSMITFLVLEKPNFDLYTLDTLRFLLLNWAGHKTVANTCYVDDINDFLNASYLKGMKGVPKWMTEAYHPTMEFLDYRRRHWPLWKF